MKYTVTGMDISLNHGGIVVLNQRGTLTDQIYIALGATKQVRGDDVVSVDLPRRERGEERERYDLRRLDSWLRWLTALTQTVWNDESATHFVAVESYAFGAQSSSLVQIGGLIEALKLMLFNHECLLRTYDPMSIKFFTTNKGNSKPEAVWDAVSKRYNYHPDVKGKPGVDRGDAYGDLCTALAIAKILHMEVKLKLGSIAMEHLEKREAYVFNRVTKTLPIPIINRRWISRVLSD